MAFEITLRNHKATPITVQVNEPIAGDWRMLTSTYPATKTEAWAARFEVPVAARRQQRPEVPGTREVVGRASC